MFGIVPLLLCAASIFHQAKAIERGRLPSSWHVYDDCKDAPEWQIHAYNSHLTVLRQSACTNYEKPFLYLLFGTVKALLLDTGSCDGNLAPALMEALGDFDGEVIVTHTHAHWDHTWGDEALKKLNFTVVPATVHANAAFFHIRDYFGHVDLGQRPIDVIVIPGHETASMAFYDAQTGILFSGDSVYPGRIFVEDWPAFVESNKRLIAFTKGRTISHVLGAHIEQTKTPYVDYPIGTIYQPDEHELALSRAALFEIQDALDSVDQPTLIRMRDYTLYPVSRSDSSEWTKPALLLHT